MITLLGSLIGFGTSFLPEVLNYFKAGQEQKHKLQQMKLEFELMEKRNEMTLRLTDMKAEIQETKGLYKHDAIDAGSFINALRGSVRPVITYVFFGLFIAVKVTALMSLMEDGNDLAESINLIWDDATSGLFAAIISFWFGGRAVSKYMKGKP
jgi:hypothetical protein